MGTVGVAVWGLLLGLVYSIAGLNFRTWQFWLVLLTVVVYGEARNWYARAAQ